MPHCRSATRPVATGTNHHSARCPLLFAARNFLSVFRHRPIGCFERLHERFELLDILIVGGDFTGSGGGSQARIARINSNGTIDGTFAPTLAYSSTPFVNAVAIQPDGKILVGGQFTSINGITATRIARLQATGAVDMTFTANLNFFPDVIRLQPDGKILVGGAFSTVNGQARKGLARLNANGSLDETFTPSLDGLEPDVLDIKVDNSGKILIGGFFAGVNGNAKPHFARLNSNGTPDAACTPATLDGGTGQEGME